MDLLEDLKASLLNFRYVMICIIIKMIELLKNYLNYLKDNTFWNGFLKRIISFYFLIFFPITYNDEKSKVWRRKHN